MATNQKDTIYIDIDDEITSIIDKVQASKERIVALVLPKRATVLQSVVNMKLLKRAAEDSKKHVVLITSESGLLPLAGAVGMYVAPSLQTKPVIPAAPGGTAAPELEAVSDPEDEADFEPDEAANTPVGQLAGPAAFAADNEVETITLDNEEPESGSTNAGAAAGAALGMAAASRASKPKKNSKLKIPDFNKFRLGLVLGGAALVALIVLFYLANVVLPQAAVTIMTDSSDIPTNANVTLDPNATQVDTSNNVLPAKIATKQQSGSQQAPATGQKNMGTPATGTLTVSEVCQKKPAPINAGTGFSANGLTFISNDDLVFTQAGWNSNGDPVCSGDVPVTSQQPGTKYNLPAGTQFSVAGDSGATATNAKDMTGGTDNIVKVVSQTDIDSAKQKISSQDSGSVKNSLTTSLQSDGYIPVTNSLDSGTPTVTSSANVGDQADTVTVTSVTTYTMYGVKQSDLEDFITANVNGKIDPSKQKILSLGADTATFQVPSPTSSGSLPASLSATTLAGPEINVAALKPQIKGKKSADVRSTIMSTPGVTDVSVKYSPFWVSHVPTNESKIYIFVQKAAATSNGNNP